MFDDVGDPLKKVYFQSKIETEFQNKKKQERNLNVI
jgi:hypothetical protein